MTSHICLLYSFYCCCVDSVCILICKISLCSMYCLRHSQGDVWSPSRQVTQHRPSTSLPMHKLSLLQHPACAQHSLLPHLRRCRLLENSVNRHLMYDSSYGHHGACPFCNHAAAIIVQKPDMPVTQWQYNAELSKMCGADAPTCGLWLQNLTGLIVPTAIFTRPSTFRDNPLQEEEEAMRAANKALRR